ncbi:unnamed protein product [Victoria cruziana]
MVGWQTGKEAGLAVAVADPSSTNLQQILQRKPERYL